MCYHLYEAENQDLHETNSRYARLRGTQRIQSSRILPVKIEFHFLVYIHVSEEKQS